MYYRMEKKTIIFYNLLFQKNQHCKIIVTHAAICTHYIILLKQLYFYDEIKLIFDIYVYDIWIFDKDSDLLCNIRPRLTGK